MTDQQGDIAPDKPRAGLAIASLLLGILSVPTLGLLGVGGIVLGVVALRKAKRAPEQYGGGPYATIGILLSGYGA